MKIYKVYELDLSPYWHLNSSHCNEKYYLNKNDADGDLRQRIIEDEVHPAMIDETFGIEEIEVIEGKFYKSKQEGY